jgi:hypothetical protein
MTKPRSVLVYVLKNRETIADKTIEVCDNVVALRRAYKLQIVQ